MRKVISILFMIATASAWAQVSNPSIISVTNAPSGACTAGLPNQQVVTTGVQYSCQNVVAGVGTWGTQGGGGSGTVNSGTTGQIAYYPTNGTTVSGNSITGAFGNQNSHSVLSGPTTGTAATPTFRPLVSLDLPPLWDSGGAVFNVKYYGAVGDGTTNDCAAITSANTARESAGGGDLYFPQSASFYNVSSACHITLAVSGRVTGAGSCGIISDVTKCASRIQSSDLTGVLFTVTAPNITFTNIGLFSTVTATAGSAIFVNGADAFQQVNYENFSITGDTVAHGFYDSIDHWVGAAWHMSGSSIGRAQRYNMWIQNTVNQDNGDWSIDDGSFFYQGNTTQANIYITGSGGGKISNSKIIGNVTGTEDGIVVNCPSCASTQLLITHNSLENFTRFPINLINGMAGTIITNNYISTTSGGTNSALNCANTGGLYFGGGSIVENPGTAVITTNNCFGLIMPYAHSSANSTANSITGGTIADYSGLQYGTLIPSLHPISVTADNSITGLQNQTGSGNKGAFISANSRPCYAWDLTTAGTDLKWWDFCASGTQLQLRAVNDTYSAATNVFTANRSGSTVTSISFGAPITEDTLYSAAGTALPTCNSGAKGTKAVVSDATTPTFLGTYASGGAVLSPVICNGTNWVTY